MGINITLDLKTTRDARSGFRCALGVAQATLRRCEYVGAQRAAIHHIPTRLRAFAISMVIHSIVYCYAHWLESAVGRLCQDCAHYGRPGPMRGISKPDATPARRFLSHVLSPPSVEVGPPK